jgi:hypothetical protein
VQDAAAAPAAQPEVQRKPGEACTKAGQCASGVCCVTAASKTGYTCAATMADCKSNVLRPVGATCKTMQECDSLVCCRTASSGAATICAKSKNDCK